MKTYFQTERLYLREWSSKDTDVLAKINASPLVMEYFPKLLSYEETASFISKINAHFEKYGFGLYALERKDTFEMVGFCGLQKIEISIPCLEPMSKSVFEIKWRISHLYWGKGYAPEAAKCVLSAAFKVFHLEEIFAFTSKLNEKSIRVMEKIGMRHNEEDDFLYPSYDDEISPHVLYRLNASQHLNNSPD